MGKLNEIAQKAYECAIRRGKIDPPTMIATTIFTAICFEEVAKSLSVRVKSPHIKEYLDVEEELADVIIVALSTLIISNVTLIHSLKPKNGLKTEWIDIGTGQLIKLIVETFVLIFCTTMCL